MSFRRIVATERNGVAVLVADESVDRLESAGIDPIWRAESPPSVPNGGAVSAAVGFPAAGGVWVIGWVLEAGEVGEADNGIVSMDATEPGFHRTDSVDVHVLLEGSLVLELDKGLEIELSPGDTVVVNGNRHRWHNRGTQPARALVTICGATRD